MAGIATRYQTKRIKNAEIENKILYEETCIHDGNRKNPCC